MNCDDVRLLAPDAALDVLDAEVRAEVLAHVATCARCRRELTELSAVADALLLAAPPAEPPPDFEGRVLERLGIAPRVPQARRWVRPLLAAAAALVIGLAGGFVLRGEGDGAQGRPIAAHLVSADGHAVGEVLVSDHPNYLVCVLDEAPAGGRYSVAVAAGDGVTDVGTFTTEGPGWAWTAELPVDGSAVRRVVIRDQTGQVRATASLPS